MFLTIWNHTIPASSSEGSQTSLTELAVRSYQRAPEKRRKSIDITLQNKDGVWEPAISLGACILVAAWLDRFADGMTIEPLPSGLVTPGPEGRAEPMTCKAAH